jgi:hypothetical protein
LCEQTGSDNHQRCLHAALNGKNTQCRDRLDSFAQSHIIRKQQRITQQERLDSFYLVGE